MKVDIEKYEREFIEDYENGDFERYLTTYRKKKLVNLVKKYKTDNFLEIGCGMEPFFWCLRTIRICMLLSLESEWLIMRMI